MFTTMKIVYVYCTSGYTGSNHLLHYFKWNATIFFSFEIICCGHFENEKGDVNCNYLCFVYQIIEQTIKKRVTTVTEYY